jgi:tryptophan halogenase
MKDKVNIVEGNVASYDDIDSDFIFDCSGAPKDFSDCNVLETIPVNSVYVTQCYWDVPKFQHTLTIARPHGWVFGIPLGNRCSIGYMYNNTISTIEEVQEDVKGIFEQFNLTPSSTTNSFSFKNYYRKQNFQGRIAFGGNASFFLEPLEATSIGFMDIIQRLATDRWSGKEDHTNEIYLRDVREYEVMIMLHYLAESNFDTDFWRFARERTKLVINHSLRENQKFTEVYQASKNWPKYTHMQRLQVRKFGYGSWSIESFYHNLSNLGLYSTLDKILDI